MLLIECIRTKISVVCMKVTNFRHVYIVFETLHSNSTCVLTLSEFEEFLIGSCGFAWKVLFMHCLVGIMTFESLSSFHQLKKKPYDNPQFFFALLYFHHHSLSAYVVCERTDKIIFSFHCSDNISIVEVAFKAIQRYQICASN